MKSYIVFGTRYSGWTTIFDWIEDHQDSAYEFVSKDSFVKYGTKVIPCEHQYYYFVDTSLVYHEDILFSRFVTSYTKTILVIRNMYDVLEDILHNTKRSVDKVVDNTLEIFEEYIDEYLGETNKIPQRYKLIILYDKWLTDIDYRNYIGRELGFNNIEHETFVVTQDYDLRNKLRYKKYITNRFKELNKYIS